MADSKVNRQYPISKDMTLIKGKNKSAQWACCFLAMMEKLSSGQWPGHPLRQQGNGNQDYYRCNHMGAKPCGNLRGVGHVEAYHKKLSGWEGD